MCSLQMLVKAMHHNYNGFDFLALAFYYNGLSQSMKVGIYL